LAAAAVAAAAAAVAGGFSPNRAFLPIRLSEIEFMVSHLPSVSVKPVAGTMDQRKEPPFCIILKED
jgi:hypothetical protein